MSLEPGRAGEPELTACLESCPRLGQRDEFPFACAGCGDCCRDRRDLVLSGFDLYRLARWMRLPPRVVAEAFCRRDVGETTCLPLLVLRPSARTGHCPFLEGKGCAVHPARPLACALYPLGQSIDPVTAKTEYFPQLPLCGAPAPGRTLADYLENSGVIQRAGTDASWAVECTRISEMLTEAGGREHPRFLPAVRRVERALYYDYSTGDEFYPQFRENLEKLYPVLQALLAPKSE